MPSRLAQSTCMNIPSMSVSTIYILYSAKSTVWYIWEVSFRESLRSVIRSAAHDTGLNALQQVTVSMTFPSVFFTFQS